MSTALIVHSSELSEKNIFGFTRYNHDTVLQIYYDENCPGFKPVYTDNTGNCVFIEDFPHKRAYLNFLKKNKKNYDLIAYVIKKDLLKEMASQLQKDFFIYIGSTDDLETFRLAPQMAMTFSDMNEKTILKEKIYYKIFKQT